MRLVEVPMVTGSAIFLNPEHVVSVMRHVRFGSQVVTPQGERLHSSLEMEELVERMSEDAVVVVDLREDLVRENLAR